MVDVVRFGGAVADLVTGSYSVDWRVSDLLAVYDTASDLRLRPPATEDMEEMSLDKLLDTIELVGSFSGVECANNPHQQIVVSLPIHLFDSLVQKVDLVSRVLEKYPSHYDENMLATVIEETIQCEEYTPSGRLLWVGEGTLWQPDFYVTANNSAEKKAFSDKKMHHILISDQIEWRIDAMDHPEMTNSSTRAGWTHPYYQCENKRWLLSYTKLMVGPIGDRLVGVLSVDVDVSGIDINQCDQLLVGENISNWQMSAFLGTHRCHNQTSKESGGYVHLRLGYKRNCTEKSLYSLG
ncbi:hypothetical protein AVEN_261638-1 [Araneus ventricosus]|uniref:GPR158/179 extracellular domain-containing protein n=1 Tax=Araneus ventricosus TaxID=182803 RepID=A0A4Y2JLB1_ARAVE|nr:hypothetical protein AVEN_261638-1 [Araneus ventricosus]